MRRLASAIAFAIILAACAKQSDIEIKDFSSFVRHMQDAGFAVASDPSPSEKLFPFTESRILVDGDPLQVYTFTNADEAAYGIKLIADDGSKVDQVPVKQPHPVFYRKENLMFVFSEDHAVVNAYLQDILGEPVFPKTGTGATP